jgi:hypothetical protein
MLTFPSLSKWRPSVNIFKPVNQAISRDGLVTREQMKIHRVTDTDTVTLFSNYMGWAYGLEIDLDPISTKGMGFFVSFSTKEKKTLLNLNVNLNLVLLGSLTW